MSTSGQLRGVQIAAFVGGGTEFALMPPRDYDVLSDGTPARTRWILRVSTDLPHLNLHFDDPTTLWELHDLIAAALPSREQNENGPQVAHELGLTNDPRFTMGLLHDVLTELEAHGYHAPEGDSRVYARALVALMKLVRAFEGTSSDPAGPGTPGAPAGGGQR